MICVRKRLLSFVPCPDSPCAVCGNLAMNEEFGEDLVKAYSCVIKSLVARCEDKESHHGTSKFHSTRLPSISIDDYVKRIAHYFQCSYECFVCSLAYIDLLLQNKSFVLNAYSIHRVILVTVMEGAKFYDDSFFNNEVYAKIGGVPVEELNHLELEFVFLIGFSLVIAPEEYQRIHNDLFRHCRMICHSCHFLCIPYLQCSGPSHTLCYSTHCLSNNQEPTTSM